MARQVFWNFGEGVLSAELGSDAGDLTLSGSFLSDLQAIATPDFLLLVVDPEAEGNGPEIVKVTAHTASSTDATIVRAQEGTTRVQHDSGTKVVASITKGTIRDLLPAGTIQMYGGAAAPDNWLLCDGSAVDRTTYADLFTAISTNFGVGDGSTTFNVPDFRQKFPIGVAASGTGSTLGGTGGAIDHTHTGPSHTHAVGTLATASDGAHTHTGPSHTHTGPSHTHAVSGTTGSTGPQTTDGASKGDVGGHSFQGTGANLEMHTHSVPAHTHSFSDTSSSSGTGNTGAGGTGATSSSGAHTHTMSGATESGGTGESGTGNPPFLAVSYIVKT